MQLIIFLVFNLTGFSVYSANSCAEVVERLDYEAKNYDRLMYNLKSSELSKEEKNKMIDELYPMRDELLFLAHGSTIEDCMTLKQSINWSKLVQNVTTSIHQLKRFLLN